MNNTISIDEYKALLRAPKKTKRKNKYGAVKTKIGCLTFDSKREARRYQELKLLERNGSISNLVLQPSYNIEINGQNICKVVLDFYYMDRDRKEHTIDVKGRDNPLSKLKRKLVQAMYRIEVELV